MKIQITISQEEKVALERFKEQCTRISGKIKEQVKATLRKNNPDIEYTKAEILDNWDKKYVTVEKTGHQINVDISEVLSTKTINYLELTVDGFGDLALNYIQMAFGFMSVAKGALSRISEVTKKLDKELFPATVNFTNTVKVDDVVRSVFKFDNRSNIMEFHAENLTDDIAPAILGVTYLLFDRLETTLKEFKGPREFVIEGATQLTFLADTSNYLERKLNIAPFDDVMHQELITKACNYFPWLAKTK